MSSVLLFGSNAWAGVQFSPFVETASDFWFTLEGDDFGLPVQTSVISQTTIEGTFWTLSDLSVVAKVIQGDDEVRFSGQFQHTLGPHADDGLGLPISFSLVAKGSDLAAPTILWPAGSTRLHSNGHYDVGNVDAAINHGIGNDITGWKFTITGQHIVPDPDVVPEPTTLGIWSVLGVGGIGFRWWRRRR
jgi:hypothetical protein